jgi:hypothetical protein
VSEQGEKGVRQDYAQFLADKAPVAGAYGIEPFPMRSTLFDFQAAATQFCLRKGRAALFLDTGLGKTICELEFAIQAAEATNGKALILTPLAVARQIEREAQRFGYGAFVVRDASEVRQGINICNYDRLDKLDSSVFGCVVLDESSILKSFTGATTRALIQSFAGTPFKLAATATPAPNDHMELGQHAEFLEVMASNEMLARWFISDQTEMGRYRLKRHGENAFWDWMASWARMAETPADLGFDASRFVLPELKIIRHRVAGEVKPLTDGLFMENVSATNMFSIKRQTAEARAEAVANLVHAEPDHAWVIWCDTDLESGTLAKLLPECAEVRGSFPIERKEAALADFSEGRARGIITKSSICGFGLNWQHADRQAFVGRSFSYESYYQAVRRSWRFGQEKPVHVHIAVAEGEDQIGRVIQRKAGDHARMKTAMADAMRRDRARSSTVKVSYNPTYDGRIPKWMHSDA